MKPYPCILLLCLLACGSLRAQTLVANLAQSNDGSSPEALQSDGRYAVFTAADAVYTRRLFIQRGAEGVPEPLVDGTTREPVLNPYSVTLIDGSVYYYTHGEGSTTYYRADLESGAITELSSLPSPGANGGDAFFTPLDGQVVFAHVNEHYTRELYATGKDGGLTLLTTLPPESYLNGLRPLKDRIYLWFSTSSSEPARFGITDGTPAGTRVHYLDDGTTYLGQAVGFDESFVLQAVTDNVLTLYYYDTLTAALIPLRERITDLPTGSFRPISSMDSPYFLRVGDDLVREVWRIDPLAGAPVRIADLNPRLDSINIYQVQVFEDLIFYTLYDRDTRLSSLYRADRQSTETTLLLGDFPNRSVNGFGLGEVVATDDAYYFLADQPASGTELWRTDGTPAGTYLVKDIYPGSDDAAISQLTAIGSDLLFVGTGPEYGSEVYRTDGTAAGTVVVADLNTAELGSVPHRFFTFNDTLFFTARTACTGFEIFKTGGTAGSTSLLRDFKPGREDTYTSPPVRIGDRFYLGLDSEYPRPDSLFVSDGTSAGTRSLQPAGLPGDLPVFLSGPGVLGDRLLVPGYFAGVGQALYSLDPETGEAELLRVFSRSGANSLGSGFLPFQDSLLLFQQHSDEFGPELWRTNGTPEGTYMVKDIYPVNDPSYLQYHIGDLTVIGDLAYFSADDGFGSRPYRSDGTEAGTFALQGGGSLASPGNFTEYAGRVYFAAGYYGNTQLYSTTGGQYDVVASPISRETAFMHIDQLVTLGDKLIFSGTTSGQGAELWAAADGESPAVLLGDLYAGPGDSYPRSLSVADSITLLFSAEVPEVGRELWSTDGTPEGTLLVADINPGTASSDPDGLYVYGAFTYFAANDGVVGRELWKYSPADLDGDGYVGADDADESDPLVNAGTNGDPNAVALACAAPGDTTTTSLALPSELRVEVFPNPTADRLTIRVPEGRVVGVEVFAGDGRGVHTATGVTSEYGLSVGHLPAGTYVVRLRDLADGRTGYQLVTVGGLN